MASKEVARLGRLKTETLTPERLRAEIGKAATNFAEETEALETRAAAAEAEAAKAKADAGAAAAALQSNLRAVTAELAATQRQLAEARAAAVAREAAARAAAAETAAARAEGAAALEKLRAELEAAKAERPAFEIPEVGAGATTTEALAGRVAELEAARVQFTVENAALKALAAKLEAEKADRVAAQPALAAADLLTLFAADVAKAAAQAPAGFELGDVEVDVRGALGAEGGALVLGLDAKRSIGAETATRLRFSLRRKVVTTQIE